MPEPTQTKKVQTRTVYNDDFMRFWKTYPAHPNQNKHAALVAWTRALDAGYDPEEIIVGAQCHRLVRLGENPEYNQHAATWLSLTYEKGRGWESYDSDHWAFGADIVTAALIADLRVAWANPANERNKHLVFRSVFAKYASNQWVDHCEMPPAAKVKLDDADYRLRELGASVKPFKLPDSQKPDWAWIHPEGDDLIKDFLARRRIGEVIE